jgi:hypothetical protein
LAAIGAAVGFGLAATAFGFVQVYQNSFSTQKRYAEIKTVSKGDRCGRKYMEKRKAMRVRAKDGPRDCRYKPAVQGSGPQPDHRFGAVVRLLTKTPSGIRSDGYISMSIRVGSGEGYELRLFPKDKTYELRRKPGGGGFPDAGPSNAIKGIGKVNRMRIQTEGSHVRAFVNGTELADVNDGNANELKGRKVEFGVGNLRDTENPTYALFDKLKVAVPDP